MLTNINNVKVSRRPGNERLNYITTFHYRDDDLLLSQTGETVM